MRQLTFSLMRVDRDVADLGSLENTLQEHPAGLISRLAKESAALEANLALTGEADGDIHGCLIFFLPVWSRSAGPRIVDLPAAPD